MASKQQTWWGQRFLETLENFTARSRLQRGRSYANRKRIQDFLIEGNLVIAKIRGSVSPYYGVYTPPLYTTTLEFRAFSPERWQLGIAEMTHSVRLLSQLMENQIPEELPALLAPLKLHLLPRSSIEVVSNCSCPDWENPCKHVAGLYYYLADLIDQDPFILFELRGLPREDLIAELSKSPLGAALAEVLQQTLPEPVPADSYYTCPQTVAVPTIDTLADFWLGASQAEGAVEAPATTVSALHIKKQGDQPAFWQVSQSFIKTMEDFYSRIKKHNEGKTL
ncbi:MAG: SWIM zinc finger family protein [Cyanobacteria bacterium J06628_6]